MTPWLSLSLKQFCKVHDLIFNNTKLFALMFNKPRNFVGMMLKRESNKIKSIKGMLVKTQRYRAKRYIEQQQQQQLGTLTTRIQLIEIGRGRGRFKIEEENLKMTNYAAGWSCDSGCWNSQMTCDSGTWPNNSGFCTKSSGSLPSAFEVLPGH